MTIAWDFLSPIQRAQLLHFRPDLAQRKQVEDLKAMREASKLLRPRIDGVENENRRS